MDQHGKFWLVSRRPKSGIKRHRNPCHRHRSLYSAQQEAERLAHLYGGHYAVLECLAVCRGDRDSGETHWVTAEEHSEPIMAEN